MVTVRFLRVDFGEHAHTSAGHLTSVSTLCWFGRCRAPAACDLLQRRDGWRSAAIQRSRGKFRQRDLERISQPTGILKLWLWERNSKGWRDTHRKEELMSMGIFRGLRGECGIWRRPLGMSDSSAAWMN